MRELSPSRIYFATDGPRSSHPADRYLTTSVREASGLIDWPCELRTLHRQSNLGCGRAVSSAISWFFEHEEAGVILEDDIRPTIDFYRFCDELLDRYASNPRIGTISGSTFVPAGTFPTVSSYLFSRVPAIWGWATWRRAWQHYRFDLSSWSKRMRPWSLSSRSGCGPVSAMYWTWIFTQMQRGQIDTWDYQWTEASMEHQLLTILPQSNLVENVGFGVDFTHSVSRPDFVLPTQELKFPLTHPKDLKMNPDVDRWIGSHVYAGHTIRRIPRRAFQALAPYIGGDPGV